MSSKGYIHNGICNKTLKEGRTVFHRTVSWQRSGQPYQFYINTLTYDNPTYSGTFTDSRLLGGGTRALQGQIII